MATDGPGVQELKAELVGLRGQLVQVQAAAAEAAASSSRRDPSETEGLKKELAELRGQLVTPSHGRIPDLRRDA